MYQKLKLLLPVLAAALCCQAAEPDKPQSGQARRTIRFVQDDAQDYMVSKIYHLKYVQSNDIAPFLMGIVMRYNMNSSVGAIEYGENNSQMITVTCPVKLMPYVDDFIAKVDRNIRIDGKTPADVIQGSGITRAVYQPKFRSGQNLLNVLVDTVIGEGPYSSVYAWDANSNQIYWKDNTSNTQYVYQFLTYLDRPAPQITITARLYEVRESTLRDIGIDYLSWKNGPGMNIIDAAYNAGRIAWDKALHQVANNSFGAFSWSYGAFATAPAFDMSFIRLLQQSGNAKIASSATLTLLNNNTAPATISLDPSYSRITKSEADHTSAVGQKDAETAPELTVTVGETPITICFDAASKEISEDGHVPATVQFYKKNKGCVMFPYSVQAAQTVEVDNYGNPVSNLAATKGFACMDFGKEQLFFNSVIERDVEQTTGIPVLCQLPILKYIFGTTTTVKEKTHIIVTVEASLVHPESNAK